MKKIIKINGMSCEHCASRVEKALLNIENVLNVEVSVEEGYASVELKDDVDNYLLKETIENLGYDVENIK